MLKRRMIESVIIALIVAAALLTTPLYHTLLRADPVDAAEYTLPAPTLSSDAAAAAMNSPDLADPAATMDPPGLTDPATAFSPTNFSIDIQNIQQRPELPAGCEVTSLTMVLNYLGYDVKKTRLADRYLPTSDEFYYGSDDRLYGPNQYEVFAGDPRSNQYGCYAPVIVKTANRYLDDVGSEYSAKDISGSDPEQLYDYLLEETPVIVWATTGMKEIPSYIVWYDSKTGKKISIPNRMHCLVLAGVQGDYLIFSDPDDQRGTVRYKKSVFEARYRALGRQAVVVTADNA